MKIILLADPNSSHTIKWVKSLAANHIELMVFGFGNLQVTDYEGYNNVTIQTLDQSITRAEGAITKLKYLKALPMLKKIFSEFKPDIVHAHYATSYGLLGALSGFHPYILSVWGGDVFSFPNKSFFHSAILQYNLKHADKILATSHALAKETELYTDKEISLTPFGVDMDQFKPMHVKSLFDPQDIVIGTIKTLEETYGIEYLIKAFKIVHDKYPHLPLKLLIVGGGSLEQKLKRLVQQLKLEQLTIFTGAIPFNDVPIYHNMLSIFVAVSNSESFGVAVIEASACAKPVIVSDIQGLPEVVDNGETGIIVPPKNPEQTAIAIEKLILDHEERERMGYNGRTRVNKYYNFKNNTEQMIAIYKGLVK